MISESRRCGSFWIVQVVNSFRQVWMSEMFLVRLFNAVVTAEICSLWYS